MHVIVLAFNILFEEGTITKLKQKLPEAAGLYNPVDVLGDAGPQLYEHALEVLLADPNVDGIIVLVSPQAMTDVPAIARSLIKMIKISDKPILCNFAGGTRIAAGEELLNKHGIPNYPSSERAVASLKALCDYSSIRIKEYNAPPLRATDRTTARKIIDDAIASGRRTLGLESMGMLEAYGIPVVRSRMAGNLPEVIEACEEIGYPVVMKIISPDISHKTDVGGIKLNLLNAEDVEHAYLAMMSDVKHYMPNAQITGVQVQQMVTGGKEVIIGMDRDLQFGPLLMFGLGGVYVEFLKDVSFAVAPIDDKEAQHMISSIKTYPLIAGVRGEKPSDIKAIIDTLLKVSQLVMDFPCLTEFEINPLMVMPEGKGCLAMDVRMTLRKE